MTEALTIPFVVRMTKEMHQALKDRAAKEDRPVAWIIRRAISGSVTDNREAP